MTDTIAGRYLVRRRSDGRYVRIVDRLPRHGADRGGATVFGYDDACEVAGFHVGDPRGHALVRLDGPLAALRDALASAARRVAAALRL